MKTKEERRQKVREAVRTLINEVNSFDHEDVVEDFLEELTHTHRTLQQSLLGVLKVTIERYGKTATETHNCDLRNSAAVSWANEVRKIEHGEAVDDGPQGKWTFAPETSFPLI